VRPERVPGAVAGLALAALLLPAQAAAHAAAPPVPADLLRTWSPEPWVLLGVGVSAFTYRRGMRAAWTRAGAGRGVRDRDAWTFLAGLGVLLVALVSPVDALGSALFSGHMFQHMLLIGVAAPLLVLGRPVVAFVWALPREERIRAGRWMRLTPARKGWALLSHPVSAWTLHTAVLWAWHAPSLYARTLESDWVHAAQHASFLGTAVLFWWVLAKNGTRARRAMGVLYLFATAVVTGALGALLTFAPVPLYSTAYPPEATGAWGLTPLEDQQLAGLVMWIPGGILYAGAALHLLGRLLAGERPRPSARPSGAVLRVAGLAAALLVLGGCRAHDEERPGAGVGDPAAGAVLIREQGCHLCHTIPGIRGARGQVGPQLGGLARQTYIAGVLPNTPDNLALWVRTPQAVSPGSAMPDSDLTEDEARHVAAYLYTLR